MKISVVLATHNEELNLERCLESVKGFADEIVIADGESTDQTVEIAKKFGAKVIATTNKPNFHINKQLAMDAATGDLILQLDADEVVENILAEFITNLATQLSQGSYKQDPVAWKIARYNHFLGKILTKGGQYPDEVIRLYLKGKARLPQKNVHEQMIVAGAVGIARGHLLHYPYPNFAAYMRKFNTYTSFEASRVSLDLLPLKKSTIWQYLIVKPIKNFFSLYLRHRGYVDHMPGFIFALMSSLHHPFVLFKVWALREKARA